MITKELPGTSTEKEIRNEFQRLAREASKKHADDDDDGAQYSGSWNTLVTVEVLWKNGNTDLILGLASEAATYLIERIGERSELCLAVRFLKNKADGTKEVAWFMGGWART